MTRRLLLSLPFRRRAARAPGAWLVAALLAFASAAIAKAPAAKEYEVKAAFLYNFTKFIEWPAADARGEARPFVIGVLGRDSFVPEVERVVRGRRIHGRPVAVKALRQPADAAQVQLVFVGGEANAEAEVACRHTGVLAVGETPEFLGRGAAIAFVFQDAKLRFAINADAATRAGLKISAQLQKLAVDVRPPR